MGKNLLYQIETTPELRSFVYQQLSELEVFFTENTVVSVFSQEDDPKKVFLKIQEGEHSIQASGEDENIFTAILIAKKSLLSQLLEIQDHVISHEDRAKEINFYKKPIVLH